MSPPKICSNSVNDEIWVGIKAGPFSVGPIIAAPISDIPCGTKDKSFYCVNTPGLTIFSAISYTPRVYIYSIQGMLHLLVIC